MQRSSGSTPSSLRMSELFTSLNLSPDTIRRKLILSARFGRFHSFVPRPKSQPSMPGVSTPRSPPCHQACNAPNINAYPNRVVNPCSSFRLCPAKPYESRPSWRASLPGLATRKPRFPYSGRGAAGSSRQILNPRYLSPLEHLKASSEPCNGPLKPPRRPPNRVLWCYKLLIKCKIKFPIKQKLTNQHKLCWGKLEIEKLSLKFHFLFSVQKKIHNDNRNLMILWVLIMSC